MATSSIRTDSLVLKHKRYLNEPQVSYAGTNTWTYVGRAPKVGALGDAGAAKRCAMDR